MRSAPIHLFVYGTLQHPHIWRGVVKGEYQKSFALLKGFQACVLKGVVYPGLIEKEDSYANGMIYYDINKEDLARLDAFEGMSYKRVEVFPSVDGKDDVSCHTYLYIGDQHIVTHEMWSFDKYLLNGHDKFIAGYSGWDNI